jgi:predicted NBD/HSP70 family sugar kinase
MLRRRNARAVLDVLLAADGGRSGGELMAATGLSRPTVHAVCDELIAGGWLVELGPRRPADPSRPGRRPGSTPPAPTPPTCWRRPGRHVGARRGRRPARGGRRGGVRGVPARPRAREERLAVARAAVERARAAAGDRPLLGAAVGVPSPVAEGRVRAGEHYLPGLAGLDLRRALDPLPVRGPVLVDNDANLALLAERWSGAATGVADAVLVLTGERLARACASTAGRCAGTAAPRGSWASCTSSAGSATPTRSAAWPGAGAAPRWAARCGRRQVVSAARAATSGPSACCTRSPGRTARALAVVATLLDPELIVLGGGAAEGADLLLTPLRGELAALVDRAPRLAASRHAGRGVLLGAVRAALDEVRPRLLEPGGP